MTYEKFIEFRNEKVGNIIDFCLCEKTLIRKDKINFISRWKRVEDLHTRTIDLNKEFLLQVQQQIRLIIEVVDFDDYAKRFQDLEDEIFIIILES